LVVDAQEDGGRLVGGGEDVGLVDVAFADGAVAVDNQADAVVGLRIGLAVTGLAHRVADTVQRMAADHHVEVMEAHLLGIPVAGFLPGEDAQQALDRQPHQHRQAVFPMTGKDVVEAAECGVDTDLNGFLAE